MGPIHQNYINICKVSAILWQIIFFTRFTMSMIDYMKEEYGYKSKR